MIWIIALATYDPNDPVWFFSTGLHGAPANFAGRVGRFLAELSFQLVGYGAYLIPAFLVVTGWHYFWCRDIDAAGTKVTGGVLLFTCTSALLSLALGTIPVSGKPFRSGGYVGDWLSAEMAEYLNRTGSAVVILTLIFLAIIISTQFSFGGFFVALFTAAKAGTLRACEAFSKGREERRRDRQRREVIAKHRKKGGAPPEIKVPPVPSPTKAEQPPKAPPKIDEKAPA